MLKIHAMDAGQLSRALGIREKEVIPHLSHVAKSATGRGERLTVQPAVCSGCGYEFKERRRLSPPGRCPSCKQSRIEGPWYQVESAR